MKIKYSLCSSLFVLLLGACGHGVPPHHSSFDPISLAQPAKGDSTIYGLACEGCTDSVVVLLPNQGGDPITYNILEAKRRGQVFGSPHMGDWMGVVLDGKKSRNAKMVIDLDELKGTWTFLVMPTLRNIDKLSSRAQRQALRAMPDSAKETFMIPREYGFTLARQSVATPVGFVRQSGTEDTSPVEYPKVRWYTEWHVYNGRLILIQGQYSFQGQVINPVTIRDTADIIYMQNDSLALRFKGNKVVGFHRQADAMKANAKANAAAAKQQEKLKRELQ